MSVAVGILGFAHGHVNAYCRRWADDFADDVRVVAGWDHDAARLAQAVEQYGLEACDSADALLSRRGLQAVVIAAETSMHADLVERAAGAGKAIVLQKPTALTLAEADRIVAAVGRGGAAFTMAWQMRTDPQNIAMKEMVRSGRLGRIFMVRRRHGLNTHMWADFGRSWHADWRLNRGMWADDASHAVDFILWLLGEPDSVVAEIGTLHDPNVPDDNGIAVFRYADGTLAEVVCSFTCPAGENTTEIVGQNGVVVQNYGDGPSCSAHASAGGVGLKWYLAEDAKWTHSDIPTPAGHGARIAGLAGPLADFLNDRRGPIADAAEARASLRMTLACYQSAAEGRRVKIRDVTFS